MGFLKRIFRKKSDRGGRTLLPECEAIYANGNTWDDLPDETKELARALRKSIESVLVQEIDKALSVSPSLREQTRDLRDFYDMHAPEVIAKALDCFLHKKTHHFQHLYPRKRLAFTVTLMHATIEQARDLLVGASRYPTYGYTDLIARLAEQTPNEIGGTYHLTILLSREKNETSVHIGMFNLPGRSHGPVNYKIVPRSLLTASERSHLNV